MVFINQIARVFCRTGSIRRGAGDGERVRQQHIVNFIGVHTRRVDDGARFDLALFGFENIEVVFAADILHAALKFEFNTVFSAFSAKPKVNSNGHTMPEDGQNSAATTVSLSAGSISLASSPVRILRFSTPFVTPRS